MGESKDSIVLNRMYAVHTLPYFYDKSSAQIY